MTHKTVTFVAVNLYDIDATDDALLHYIEIQVCATSSVGQFITSF